jgi:DNA-binding SARP family transcriptional activator
MGTRSRRETPSATRRWTLRLDGAAALIDPDGDVHVLERRAAALFALLAVEREVTRARAAVLLWPDTGEAHGRHALRQQLLRLRKLGGGDLVEGDQVLRLAAAVEYVPAGREGHNVLLASHEYDDSEALAEWVVQQRQRLRRERVQWWCAQGAEAERKQDFERAVAAARWLVDDEPESEEHHRQLMRVHYLRGDVAAAQGAYERLRQMLQLEFQATPSLATEQLAATLRRAQAPSTQRSTLPITVLRPPQLVGRDHVVRAIETCLQGGQIALIEGEAGLGKTRLIEELARNASRVTVKALARPGDARVPFSVLARLVREVRQRAPTAAQVATPNLLGALLPELGAAHSIRNQRDLAQLLHEVHELIVAVSPALLVVDDLQFADVASVEAIQSIATDGKADEPAPTYGWLFAYRSSELPAEIRGVLDILRDRRAATALSLRPLEVPEVSQLLSELGLGAGSGSALAQRIARHTGGNPFFILETVKILLQEPADMGLQRMPLPPSVGDLLERRLRRLGERAQRLTWCAGVAGVDLDAALAAHVLGVPALDLADAWRELEDAQLLCAGSFVHDLVAEAARRTLPQAIASHLHGEVAGYLETRGGDPARIAQHWLDAGLAIQAAPHLRAAGERALAVYRTKEAADHFEAASAICEDAGDRQGAFDATFRAAWTTSNEVGARFSRAAARLRELARSDADWARVWLSQAVLILEFGPLDALDDVARKGIECAQRAGDKWIEAELTYGVGVHWHHRRRIPLARDFFERSNALFQELGDTGRGARGRIALSVASAALGQGTAALEQARIATQMFQDLSDRHGVAEGANVESFALLLLGQAEAAQGAARRCEELNTDLDTAPNLRAGFWANAARARLANGDLGAALAYGMRIEEFLSKHPAAGAMRLLCRHWLLFAVLGRRDLARAGIERLVENESVLPDDRSLVRLFGRVISKQPALESDWGDVAGWEELVPRCEVLIALSRVGNPTQAIPLLRLATRAARDGGLHGVALPLSARLAAMLVQTGDSQDAQNHAREAWALVEQGLTGITPPFEIAADLHLALRGHDELLATQVRARGAASVLRAAATLPPEYRESFLHRNDECRSLLTTGFRATVPDVPSLRDASSAG